MSQVTEHELLFKDWVYNWDDVHIRLTSTGGGRASRKAVVCAASTLTPLRIKELCDDVNHEAVGTNEMLDDGRCAFTSADTGSEASSEQGTQNRKRIVLVIPDAELAAEDLDYATLIRTTRQPLVLLFSNAERAREERFAAVLRRCYNLLPSLPVPPPSLEERNTRPLQHNDNRVDET